MFKRPYYWTELVEDKIWIWQRRWWFGKRLLYKAKTTDEAYEWVKNRTFDERLKAEYRFKFDRKGVMM